jgi:hypothetical protein
MKKPGGAPCPLCGEENQPDALVCSTCRRDIAIPAALLTERRNVLRRKDELQEAVDQLVARLGPKRWWFGMW